MRNVMFEASWSTYEEHFHVRIWEQNGKLFKRTKGHSVMIGDYNVKCEVTQEEAMETMLEYADCEDEPEVWPVNYAENENS
jgi:hypothetical protein